MFKDHPKVPRTAYHSFAYRLIGGAVYYEAGHSAMGSGLLTCAHALQSSLASNYHRLLSSLSLKIKSIYLEYTN